VRVAVTGASGLIGSRLSAVLRERGDEVVSVPREAVGDQLAELLRGVDGVVNLAGEPVAQRWNAAVKERIRSSRLERTASVVDAVGRLPETSRPSVLVSASGAGYYGDRGAEELTEEAPPGGDFLASVCVDWEHAAAGAARSGVRVVCIRTGIVLTRSGGALAKMLTPFRLGVGGRIGSGEQYMPWIHIDDIVGLYLESLSGDGWSGAINASAPAPATNAEFTRALGRALKRPTVFPVPVMALRALYGEMATVLVTGQRMLPARALSLGYSFAHPSLPAALAAALAQ
jgi:uncharacterized protein (TIGR01777 family)